MTYKLLQLAGRKAVLAQHLHLGVAKLFQVGGGLLETVGQGLAPSLAGLPISPA